MDIATGLGLVGGAIVVATVILMGGSFGTPPQAGRWGDQPHAHYRRRQAPFAPASDSLRQALQDMPDLAELSKRVTIGRRGAAHAALARLWAVGSFPSTAPILCAGYRRVKVCGRASLVAEQGRSLIATNRRVIIALMQGPPPVPPDLPPDPAAVPKPRKGRRFFRKAQGVAGGCRQALRRAPASTR